MEGVKRRREDAGVEENHVSKKTKAVALTEATPPPSPSTIESAPSYSQFPSNQVETALFQGRQKEVELLRKPNARELSKHKIAYSREGEDEKNIIIRNTKSDVKLEFSAFVEGTWLITFSTPHSRYLMLTRRRLRRLVSMEGKNYSPFLTAYHRKTEKK